MASDLAEAVSGCLAPKAGFLFALGYLHIQENFANNLLLPIPSLLSLTIFELSLKLEYISCFMIGIGAGVEAEARDSSIIVQKMVEAVKALRLYRKLPPDILSCVLQ